MSKIDLIDNKWSDLVFEGKNQAYGAYQLRRETGKRNVKALLVMFAIGVAIAAFVAIKGVVENAMKNDVAIEADVELSKLAEKKEAKVERKEQPKLEKVDNSTLSLNSPSLNARILICFKDSSPEM